MKNNIFLISFVYLALWSCSPAIDHNQPPGKDTLTQHDTDSQVKAIKSMLSTLKTELTSKYGELDISKDTNETYRFILFEPNNTKGILSAVITIWETGENYQLVTKYEKPGQGVIVSEKKLTNDQWIQFQAEISGSYFWSMMESSSESATNNQLSYWVMQGKRNAKYYRDGTELYHTVTRQSPYHGCFRSACELLISFSEVKELQDAISR